MSLILPQRSPYFKHAYPIAPVISEAVPEMLFCECLCKIMITDVAVEGQLMERQAPKSITLSCLPYSATSAFSQKSKRAWKASMLN